VERWNSGIVEEWNWEWIYILLVYSHSTTHSKPIPVWKYIITHMFIKKFQGILFGRTYDILCCITGFYGRKHSGKNHKSRKRNQSSLKV